MGGDWVRWDDIGREMGGRWGDIVVGDICGGRLVGEIWGYWLGRLLILWGRLGDILGYCEIFVIVGV